MPIIPIEEAMIHAMEDIAALDELISKEQNKWLKCAWEYHLKLNVAIIGYLTIENLIMAQIYINELNRSIRATCNYIEAAPSARLQGK